MPVLNTPWLAIHVSLVMTAYALLGLTFVTAVAGLVSPASAERMRRVSLSALYPAEWLLGMGIITGAVWANISWGRYWSWDPKETLALVTFLIYALPLHSNVSSLRAPRRYHVYMLLAILSVAANYCMKNPDKALFFVRKVIENGWGLTVCHMVNRSILLVSLIFVNFAVWKKSN